jgi:hypothetical protein
MKCSSKIGIKNWLKLRKISFIYKIKKLILFIKSIKKVLLVLIPGKIFNVCHCF